MCVKHLQATHLGMVCTTYFFWCFGGWFTIVFTHTTSKKHHDFVPSGVKTADASLGCRSGLLTEEIFRRRVDVLNKAFGPWKEEENGGDGSLWKWGIPPNCNLCGENGDLPSNFQTDQVESWWKKKGCHLSSLVEYGWLGLVGDDNRYSNPCLTKTSINCIHI